MIGRGRRNGKIAGALRVLACAPTDVTAGWLMSEARLSSRQAHNAITQAAHRGLITRVVRGVYRPTGRAA